MASPAPKRPRRPAVTRFAEEGLSRLHDEQLSNKLAAEGDVVGGYVSVERLLYKIEELLGGSARMLLKGTPASGKTTTAVLAARLPTVAYFSAHKLVNEHGVFNATDALKKLEKWNVTSWAEFYMVGKQYVLFIDEAHTLFGAKVLGEASGLLKPDLDENDDMPIVVFLSTTSLASSGGQGFGATAQSIQNIRVLEWGFDQDEVESLVSHYNVVPGPYSKAAARDVFLLLKGHRGMTSKTIEALGQLTTPDRFWQRLCEICRSEDLGWRGSRGASINGGYFDTAAGRDAVRAVWNDGRVALSSLDAVPVVHQFRQIKTLGDVARLGITLGALAPMDEGKITPASLLRVANPMVCRAHFEAVFPTKELRPQVCAPGNALDALALGISFLEVKKLYDSARGLAARTAGDTVFEDQVRHALAGAIDLALRKDGPKGSTVVTTGYSSDGKPDLVVLDQLVLELLVGTRQLAEHMLRLLLAKAYKCDTDARQKVLVVLVRGLPTFTERTYSQKVTEKPSLGMDFANRRWDDAATVPLVVFMQVESFWRINLSVHTATVELADDTARRDDAEEVEAGEAGEDEEGEANDTWDAVLSPVEVAASQLLLGKQTGRCTITCKKLFAVSLDSDMVAYRIKTDADVEDRTELAQTPGTPVAPPAAAVAGAAHAGPQMTVWCRAAKQVGQSAEPLTDAKAFKVVTEGDDVSDLLKKIIDMAKEYPIIARLPTSDKIFSKHHDDHKGEYGELEEDASVTANSKQDAYLYIGA